MDTYNDTYKDTYKDACERVTNSAYKYTHIIYAYI